jgi:hypothetical protein
MHRAQAVYKCRQLVKEFNTAFQVLMVRSQHKRLPEIGCQENGVRNARANAPSWQNGAAPDNLTWENP